jgi:hypothetical protein
MKLSLLALAGLAAAPQDVTQVFVYDQAEVVATSELNDDGRLVLRVQGRAIGSVVDEFCKANRPPRTVRFKISNLPDGRPVAVHWFGAGRTGRFRRAEGYTYVDLPVPSGVGPATEYDFEPQHIDSAADEPASLVLTVTDECQR